MHVIAILITFWKISEYIRTEIRLQPDSPIIVISFLINKNANNSDLNTSMIKTAFEENPEVNKNFSALAVQVNDVRGVGRLQEKRHLIIHLNTNPNPKMLL